MYEVLIQKAEVLERYALKMHERDRSLSHRMRMKALELRRKARLLIIDTQVLTVVREPLHY